MAVADRQEEPATEAGRALLGWHDAGHTAFLTDDDQDIAMGSNEVRDYIIAIEREAQVSAPLDVERLQLALRIVIGYPVADGGWPEHTARQIVAEYAYLSNQPSTEPAPTEAGHPWNGVNGHDCVDCDQESIWKCDVRAHGGPRTDDHGRLTLTPAENLVRAQQIVAELGTTEPAQGGDDHG